MRTGGGRRWRVLAAAGIVLAVAAPQDSIIAGLAAGVWGPGASWGIGVAWGAACTEAAGCGAAMASTINVTAAMPHRRPHPGRIR